MADFRLYYKEIREMKFLKDFEIRLFRITCFLYLEGIFACVPKIEHI